MLENLSGSLKQKMGQAKEMADTVSGKVTELKNAGIDKIKSYMDEISNGLPLIEEAGFKVDSINIDLGIPPDIAIGFSKKNEVSGERIAELMAQNEDKKLLVMILNALKTANNLQSKITFDKFTFAGVSVKLGIPPQVSLKYK